MLVTSLVVTHVNPFYCHIFCTKACIKFCLEKLFLNFLKMNFKMVSCSGRLRERERELLNQARLSPGIVVPVINVFFLSACH